MQKIKEAIVLWLKDQNDKAKTNGFVVGVSGGVDSALVSTLCVLTGLKTLLIQMPINRTPGPISERAQRHCDWLCKGSNAAMFTRDLSETFNSFIMEHPDISHLAMANARSRLRMVSLYTFSNNGNLLVAGTGNKVEDYGVGFCTKGGDSCVDISPIGDLIKSEVRVLARYLGVADDIVDAVPTDELWDDCRSDEEQLGATYDELEWAMKTIEECKYVSSNVEEFLHNNPSMFSVRQKEVLGIYMKRHESSRHKMSMPPICYLKDK
jgi:NAD+ synthase